MKSITSFRSSLVRSLVSLVVSSFCASVFAVGPVALSSLPGDANLVKSGDGSGESWGRTGGQDWSFSNFDLSLFDSLTWGAVDASSVGIALDGTINNGTAEILSISSVIGNRAIWVGATQVNVFSGNTVVTRSVETQFVLTVTSGGGPLNLVVNSVNNLPNVNVMASGSAFVANLQMQARLQGAPNWEGALDLFDRLSTTGDGLALTSFNHGFFFDLTGGGTSGLTLEEHDSNMLDQTGQLEGALDFLTIESVNRLTGLDQRASDLENLVRQLSDDELRQLLAIEQLFRDSQGGENPPDLEEIRQIVSDSRQELTDIIVFLWGLSEGGENFPDPADVAQISDLSTQQSVDLLGDLVEGLLAEQSAALIALKQQLENLQTQLDAVQAVNELSLEVISSKRDSGRYRRLLVLAQENGVPTNVSGFIINAITDSKSAGFKPSAVEYTDRVIGEGLIEVSLSLPRSLRSAEIFHITAQHDHGDGVLHTGTTIATGSSSSDDD